jgi:hypothetical protein
MEIRQCKLTQVVKRYAKTRSYGLKISDPGFWLIYKERFGK